MTANIYICKTCELHLTLDSLKSFDIVLMIFKQPGSSVLAKQMNTNIIFLLYTHMIASI